MRRSSIVLLLLILLLLIVVFLLFYVLNITHAPQPGNQSSSAPQHEQIPHTRTQVQPPAGCSSLGISCESQYFSAWQQPADGACTPRTSNGYPVPDPNCTPGGINPSVTLSTLTDPAWTTKCIRNCESSESQKHIAYGWYSLTNPPNNSGPTQVCELDHVVPLELGGADGLGNIWPQCGPDNAALADRYFKQKDMIENYLARQVRDGAMPLADAQKGIAQDWTQYLPAAQQFCGTNVRC